MLYPVKINGKWGYIDKDGKIAIKPKFDLALGFQEGRARIKLYGKWGYIDKDGKIIIDRSLRNMRGF